MAFSSQAKELSNTLNTKYGITWVTPLIVQIFIVLSLAVRRALRTFLTQELTVLTTQKAKLVRLSLKGDVIANAVGSLRAATAIALQPINSLLQTIPLDTILQEIPDMQNYSGDLNQNVANADQKVSVNNTIDSIQNISSEFSSFLSTLMTSIPVKIPIASISTMIGGDLDFFDDVKNFSDLQQKLDDLEFRLSRASALSTYANAGSAFVDNQIAKVQVYIDLIETLDI